MDDFDEEARLPERRVRALYTDRTIRVYQAFSPEIAEPALLAQTFVPPFKRTRMTWIKPSFTWMMYRAGWGEKCGQERILAIDIIRDGFEWLLANATLSNFDKDVHVDVEEWRRKLAQSPVRIQWDPERTVSLAPLPWRTIQIGIKGLALHAYVDQWITKIADMTPLAQRIKRLVRANDRHGATKLLPLETDYPVPQLIAQRIGVS